MKKSDYNPCASKPYGAQARDAGIWWTLWDLNPRHLGCKPSTLPTELNAPVSQRLSLTFLSLHLESTEMNPQFTMSMVASRSGPTPTLVHGTPTSASIFLMYNWAAAGSVE